MANLSEKLLSVYGQPKETNPDSNSWITKRKYREGDLCGELREIYSDQEVLSEVRVGEVLDKETVIKDCKEDIFTTVAEYLLAEYGEDGLETRLTNFGESWQKMFDKYGDDLVYALAERTDDINEDPFVNFAGYLNKEMVKGLVSSIRARAKQLKNP